MTDAPAIRRGAPPDAPALAPPMRAFQDHLDAIEPPQADADLRAPADGPLTHRASTVRIA